MNRCEETQLELSAVVDGEAEAVLLPAALDHLLDCSRCQVFYRASRRIDEVAAAVAAVVPAEPSPASSPRGARSVADAGPRSAVRPTPRPVLAGLGVGRVAVWRAAAMVILAVGLFALGRGALEAGTAIPADTDLVVRLEENRGKMSEERFVELTVELLRSDRRYHEKMLEIMNGVAPEQGAPESAYPSAAVFEGGDDRDRDREDQL